MTQESTQERPLVTFALFAYNQEKYIREAIEGAFAQTYEPLEIIISDDFSTDRTFEIIKEMERKYRGKHSLYIQQNKCNLGVSQHVNGVIGRAKGKYLVASAGDDVSLPERTALTVEILEKSPEAKFCDTSYISIDKNGDVRLPSKSLSDVAMPINLRDLLTGHVKGLTGATRTYCVDALMSYPTLNGDCPTEDSPSVLRCLLVGQGFYLPRPGIKRRLHDNNLSGKESLRKMNFEGIWKQYEDDALHAYKNGYINRTSFGDVRLWIATVSYERSLLQKMNNAGVYFWGELVSTLSSRSSPRIKLNKLLVLSKAFFRKNFNGK